MSVLAADEFRLLFAVLLNALVLAGGWRLARRWNDDRLDAAADAGLLYFLVQYLSVCVPGVAGALHPLTIALVAVLFSAAMAAAGGRWRRAKTSSEPAAPPHVGPSKTARAVVAAALFFVAGYAAALVWHQRQLPVISNDAITYHLPAAVQWLQTGRLGLYPAWFYNPANSYSPLAGSAFIAWWLAPIGNDVLARFVQVGPMILLLIGTMKLCRRLGATAGVAALVAAALVLARPFMSQTILTKDDLFVAAFFLLLIDALSRERLAQPVGPWRVGIALGLLLATKFTVLLSLPILLLMLHRGWTWRRAGIALACAAVLAGPWYLRNWIRVGNPLYPTDVKLAGITIFRGMLNVHRSQLLSTPRGVWDVFTRGYYALPAVLATILIAAWVAAVICATRRRHWGEPLVRTCLIGPVIGIALFVLAAPYGEMRFAYPSLVLLFAAAAMAMARLPQLVQLGVAAAIVIIAALTAFIPQLVIEFTLPGLILAAVAGYVATTRHACRIATIVAITALIIATMVVYVQWTAYVKETEQDSIVAWADPHVYGDIGEVWGYVRGSDVPKGATIAYANTFFAYPLQGFAYDHRVVYAPTRAGLEKFTDMPRIEQPITGEEIVPHVCDMLRDNPDREQWLRRLRESAATYLVVMKQDPARPGETIVPPELEFIRAPQVGRLNGEGGAPRFVVAFDNPAGSVFRINW